MNIVERLCIYAVHSISAAGRGGLVSSRSPLRHRERNFGHTGQVSLSILDAVPAVAVDNVVSLFKVAVCL